MERVSRDGISYINRMVSTAIAPMLIFFITAGKFNILAGWFFFGIFVLLNLFNIIFLLISNPSLLNERGKTKKDIKKKDHLYIFLYLLLTHVIPPLLTGLEIRVFHTMYYNVFLTIAGICLLILSGVIENTAMYHNRFYERNIRIQSDQNQVVIADGPYGIIRHPGYLSYILRFIAFPLIVVTYVSAISILAGIFVIILRTKYEDTVLDNELTGYSDYKKSVKYRLFPFVW